jgi:hypothetical protein
MAKWSREQIIREILRRESAGLPFTVGGEDGVNNALYQASSRIFGSWANAVMAAGITPNRAQRHFRWSTQRILLIIRALSRRERPLRPGELKQRYRHLMNAARRRFGSWPKAVIAAGIDPQKMRRVAPWTRERVIEAILKRALNNESLSKRLVEPRSLADAGTKIFGTWESALWAAGLDPQSYGCKKRNTCNTIPSNTPMDHEQPSLSRQDTATSKSISDSECVSSSNQSKECHNWSDQGVIEAIRIRLRKRQKLNAQTVCKDDLALYQAARRRYGNWSNALVAAGLNPLEFRKYGTGNRG